MSLTAHSIRNLALSESKLEGSLGVAEHGWPISRLRENCSISRMMLALEFGNATCRTIDLLVDGKGLGQVELECNEET